MKRIISVILSVAMLMTVMGTIPFTAGAANMTDADFFAKFNYAAYPDLSAVKAAVDKKDYTAAKEELVNYFIQRKAEGKISAFEIGKKDENYGQAVLPLDNILTGPYEFDIWLNRFTADSKEYKAYDVDLTNKVSRELNNQAISVMLFERQKQSYPVIVASKENAGYEPVLTIETAEGDTYKIQPDNDTYIHSGEKDASKGGETELYVKEQSDSESSPFGSQTRRAYINFPLNEAANKTVTKATLTLYAKMSADCTLDSIDVHVISVGDTMWNEDGLCWNKVGGNIYSYQNAENPTWQQPSGADGEYQNVTARFWYGRAMAYEYLSYLEDPEAYAKEHPLYPDGSIFGEKLISLMDAFATQKNYGFNRTLETGERLNRWVDIIDALIDTPAIKDNPDKFCNILSFIWGDCNYLAGLNIADGGPWWSNWRIVANTGFFKANEFFPEFSTYNTWRNKVEGNVEYTLNLLYNDDMSFTEAGPSYAIWCAQLFGECARIAEQNGNPMKKEFTERLRYAVRYALESIYPDGFDTNIGDSNYKDQMQAFRDLAKFYGSDSVINAFVNGTDEGAEYFSNFYESVNTAFFRNSWDSNETVYVQFNNNPNDGHYHPDSNQVLMYAYGKPLLVDSGRYSYSKFNSIYDELRYASAHNTVEAVGVSMGKHTASATPFTYAVNNDKFGFATTMQKGFPGVEHTRNVLYLPEGYAIVSDYVDGSNANQEYRQNWHFMPSSNAEMTGNTATTDFYNEANVTIANAGSDTAVIRDGYHSADYGLVAASKYASYSKTGAEVKFDTVLYPTRAGETANVTVTDKAADDNSVSYITANINGKDIAYYVKNTGSGREYLTDAKMLYAEKDGENQMIAVVGGSYVIEALESKNKFASMAMSFDGSVLDITGEKLVADTNADTAAAITAFDNVTKVILNGEEIPFEMSADGKVYAVRSTDISGSGDVSVNGREFNIVDNTNLITNGDFTNGMTDWTNAETGAELGWTPVDNSTYTGGKGMAVTNNVSAGGSAASTMRRYIKVTPGKKYYVSYNAYNTGDATSNQSSAGMGAVVAVKGEPQFGEVTTMKYKDYVEFGGFNSWSPNAPSEVNRSRQDQINQPGMNKHEFILDIPEDSENIMISFGAWTPVGRIYWSNFEMYEVEEIRGEDDITTVTASFTDSDGNVLQDSVTEETGEGIVYIYDAPKSIEKDDVYYVLDSKASNLSVKTSKGENFVSAVYKKHGLVSVEFVNLSGETIAEKVTYEAEIGSAFDGAEKAKATIATSSKLYTFVPSSTDKIASVSEKMSENVIHLSYKASDEEFDGLLGLFTFDDEETGFTSDWAKAKSAGVNTLSDDAMRGKALYLSGSGSNYLTVTDKEGGSLLTGMDEATIVFYAKVTGGKSWSVFMAPDTNAQSYPNEHYVGMLHDGNNLTVERYNNAGARPAVINTATEANVWKKYALVIKENETTVYVDGVPTTLESAYKLSDILGNNSVIQIGKANWGSGEFFTGYIDELSIYSRALTEQEINAMDSSSNVTVKYVDGNGNKMLDDAKITVLSGVKLSEENIPYETLIDKSGVKYMVDTIEGLGVTADGRDLTVTVRYIEAVTKEITFKATKGDSLKGSTGITDMSSETGGEYSARLMVDNRWNKRAGLVGFAPQIEDGAVIAKATVKLHVNDKNGTTGPKIYSGAALPSDWSRGKVNNFALPEEAIASGSVEGTYITFDVTDYAASGKGFDFALFTSTDQEYIIYDSENTSYVPEMIITVATPKKTSFEIKDSKAVYTSYDGENAAVIVAYYNKDGELIKAVHAEGTGETVEVKIEVVEGAASYKAFVWNSLSGQKPLAEPIEVKKTTE